MGGLIGFGFGTTAALLETRKAPRAIAASISKYSEASDFTYSQNIWFEADEAIKKFGNGLKT